MYKILTLAAPAVTMLVASWWQRKTVFWFGALVSIGATYWLMVAEGRARGLAKLERLSTPEGYRTAIERDVPWTEFGLLLPVLLTLLWGLVSWYLWRWTRRRRPTGT
ncbi:MAG: hypothetical protein DIU62_001345 [Pseudomonadota bacterium]|jgi:formate hydrogenlyase subunit 3/multisubunit Na+/H+ antiporter MnhD subunit|nr:MAG: hypothetical protein DIU62_02180 [Pseudomonadota bacterium]